MYSDPYNVKNHRYKGTFEDFAELMKGEGLPFDTTFVVDDGFISRQSPVPDPAMRSLTWHFHRDCFSFFSAPINRLDIEDPSPAYEKYSHWHEFVELLTLRGYSAPIVLDTNYLVGLINAVMRRQREIMDRADVKDQYIANVRLENIWRTTPFFDHEKYLRHVCEYGIPIQQQDETWELGELPQLPVNIDRGSSVDDGGGDLRGFALMMLQVFQGLGIPGGVLALPSNEFNAIAERHRAFQESLHQNGLARFI